MARIYLQTGERERALVQVEKCLLRTKSVEYELYIQCLIQKALILLSLNNGYDALTALMGILIMIFEIYV